MKWRPISEFDPDNYYSGWILFYSIDGGRPIVFDCNNRNQMNHIGRYYRFFDLFLFIEQPEGEL